MIWQCGEINAPEATARRRGAGVPDRNLHMAGFGYRVLLSRKSSEPAPGYRHSRIGLSSIMPDHPCPLASSPALALLCWGKNGPVDLFIRLLRHS